MGLLQNTIFSLGRQAARISAAVCFAGFSFQAAAAPVTTHYQPLGGGKWQMDVRVENDLDPPSFIHQFTLYLPGLDHGNLALISAPAGWDWLLLQPDLNLPADGFLDGLVLDPADALGGGGTLDGISLTFDWLGAGTPGGLTYVLYDADFNELGAGRTAFSIGGTEQRVPEPATLALALAGLVVGRLLTRRAQASMQLAR